MTVACAATGTGNVLVIWLVTTGRTVDYVGRHVDVCKAGNGGPVAVNT